MVVHAFGAYFGLAVSRIIHNDEEVRNAEAKEGSVYHSDIFAMIGNFSWLRGIPVGVDLWELTYSSSCADRSGTQSPFHKAGRNP